MLEGFWGGFICVLVLAFLMWLGATMDSVRAWNIRLKDTVEYYEELQRQKWNVGGKRGEDNENKRI